MSFVQSPNFSLLNRRTSLTESRSSVDSERSVITYFLHVPKQVNFDSKIDTEADHCVFERKFGEELGLKIENGIPQRFSTATGTFRAFGHNVTLITEDLEFDSYVFFYENENQKTNVLGRFGWIDRIILGVIDHDGKLYLSRYE